MGGSSSCMYKNQGERIDELRDEINDSLNTIRQRLYRINDDGAHGLNNYFVTLRNLYGGNGNDGDDYYAYVSKHPNTNNSNFINVLGNNEYYFNNVDNNLKGSIQNYYDTSMNNTRAFDDKIKTINELLIKIKEKYGDIDLNILKNDNKINEINQIKENISKQTYSVSFFENLLIQSYKQLYNAIYVENKVLFNNNSMKQDIYSTDNSKYTYETSKINFYENFNTFLFYFYYILIFLSIIVIGIYNINLLTTFSIFHVLLLILILYPIYILKYQNFLYKYFEKLLLYFKDVK
jgi:hypothetical protein